MYSGYNAIGITTFSVAVIYLYQNSVYMMT